MDIASPLIAVCFALILLLLAYEAWRVMQAHRHYPPRGWLFVLVPASAAAWLLYVAVKTMTEAL